MIEVSVDGSNDEANEVVVRSDVIDGTLTFKFTDTAIQRTLVDDSGEVIRRESISWDDAAEDLWFG